MATRWPSNRCKVGKPTKCVCKVWMPLKFAKPGGRRRVMPYMRFCKAKRWMCKGMRTTAMDVCWRNCHVKVTMWVRGWWGKAMRGRMAIKGGLVCMTRSRPMHKANNSGYLRMRERYSQGGLENDLVRVTCPRTMFSTERVALPSAGCHKQGKLRCAANAPHSIPCLGHPTFAVGPSGVNRCR